MLVHYNSIKNIVMLQINFFNNTIIQSWPDISKRNRSKQRQQKKQLEYFYFLIIKEIQKQIHLNNNIFAMQAQINPVVQIMPFDDKYAVKAQIEIEKDSQKLFMMKSFLMFVLEVRSAMNQQSIQTLKLFILQTCEQLLDKEGIDNIGFVINGSYYTIRNANYLGIKDLLNANVVVSDSVDIRDTILCLRNSITLEAKKVKQTKISIVMFCSNVAENLLNPVKASYRWKMNQYLQNYDNEVKKLNKAITALSDDCYFYSIGFVKKFNNNKQPQYGNQISRKNDGVDISLLYKLSSLCKRKNYSFNICESYQQLRKSFAEVSSLIVFQFHQFSVMLPTLRTKKLTYSPITAEDYSIKVIEQNKMEQQIVINDQEIENYLKEKEQMKQQLLDQMEQIDANYEEDEIEYIPDTKINQNVQYIKLDLVNENEKKFSMQKYEYFSKQQLDLKQIHDNGYHIFLKCEQKVRFPQKKSHKLLFKYTPHYICKNVDYHEPNPIQLIQCQSEYYQQQLRDIIWKMQNDVLRYKKKFIGMYKKTRLFQTYLQVDEHLQNELRNQLWKIQQIVKQMYINIFKNQFIRNEKQKRRMYQLYSNIKSVIDTTNQVFVNILKKQIKNQDINKLSEALNHDKLKSSLRRKLIKRINANPKLVDDVYDRIEQACSQIPSFIDLEAKFKHEKSQVGNCMYTFRNFATSLKSRDGLGIIFQIQRPQSAIADPGRIKIRQVSTLVSSISKFFQIHQFLIKEDYDSVFEKNGIKFQEPERQLDEDYIGCPCCCSYMQVYRTEQEIKTLKKQAFKNEKIFGIVSRDYKENWDYWNRVDNKNTYFGVMPLYICQENWKISRQLIKLCMGWTVCGQPLGYTYSQTQTVPFMVLSSLIREVQKTKYQIEELKAQCQKQYEEKKISQIRHRINNLKHKMNRHQNLLKHVELTCKAIMQDMSGVNVEQPLNKQVIQKYTNYEKPINRTVDIINNNSSFLGQIFTMIKFGLMEKPPQQKFHQFFKRLVQEELRRETDGWNQQEVEEKFINKLLNVRVQQMEKPTYIVMESEYLDRFQIALAGHHVYRTQFQIQRQALQMMIKQNNKFNDTQRLTIIEYKRLYENRVLWMWYVRFRIYKQIERILIHKWKCLDLTNSYQLFAMIIQNKKQRKNWKRRQAIMNGEYVDPFDYYSARQYLEKQFVKMRNKKEAKNIVLLNAEKYSRASEVFAKTKDLKQAAGAIMNLHVGGEIKYYYNELFHHPSFLEQKLKILLNGQFQGIQLFKHGWKMSKKKMQKLRSHYKYQFMKYQYMF